MALVHLRHFIVDAESDPGTEEMDVHFTFKSSRPLEVSLATLLEANTMAERDVDRDLRYRVLQNELRIILSYLHDEGPDGKLQLDAGNFAATAAHIKRFLSESVGLGMLTAAVQDYFAWELGADAIYNFDVLPTEKKLEFSGRGVRPDLLFEFKDDGCALAGEARGRSEHGPHGEGTRTDQRQRMKDMLSWSADHGAYPVAMTWAYLGGDLVQVDLFTMSDQSIGGLAYLPPMEAEAYVTERVLFTDEAIGRGERRAARLFETAPAPPARERRRLFGREVRGDWVTADLVRPTDVRLFLGAMETPAPTSDVRAARSRGQRGTPHQARRYQTALNERMVIVVARSESPEPEWSGVEAAVEHGVADD
jgi:hypothetical protein